MVPLRVRTALLLVLAACGSSTSEATGTTPVSTSESPDGGSAPPPIVDGVIKLTLPSEKTILKQGSETAVVVQIDRAGGFGGPVSVTLVGAPDKVTADTVEVPSGVSSAKLRISVTSEVPQGDLKGMRITARGAQGSAEVDLPAFVRGATGIHDTTFGGGTGESSAGSLAVAVDGTGRFVASKGNPSSYARYTAEGAPDPSFQTGVLPMNEVRQLAVVGDKVYACGPGTASIVFARLTSTGALDLTYGAGGKTVINSGAGTFHGCFFSPLGKGAASWSDASSGYLSWVDASGVSSGPSIVTETFGSSSAYLDELRFTGRTGKVLVRVNFGSIYDVGFGKPDLGASVLAIAPVPTSTDVYALTAQKVLRVGANGAVASGFASALGIPAGSVTGSIVVQPKDGKLLVAAGHDLTSQVVRLVPDGSQDSFGPPPSGALSAPVGIVRSLALQPDGRILLFPVEGSGPVRRYWGD